MNTRHVAFTGDELVRWLRTNDVKAKVVAVSARDTGNEALVAAGANRACSKIEFAKIQAVLHELVDDSAASRHDAPGIDTDGPAES